MQKCHFRTSDFQIAIFENIVLVKGDIFQKARKDNSLVPSHGFRLHVQNIQGPGETYRSRLTDFVSPLQN